MDFIPEKSEIQVENIDCKDEVLRQLTKDLGVRHLIPGMKGQKGQRKGNRKEWTVLFLNSFLDMEQPVN